MAYSASLISRAARQAVSIRVEPSGIFVKSRPDAGTFARTIHVGKLLRLLVD